MPRKIDTAVIEYVPDFSSFERESGRQLGSIFSGIEQTARKSATTVENSFQDIEREIEQVFNDIARSGEVDMGRLTAVADRTANEIGNDFQRGGEEAERSFDELQHAAKRNFDQIERQARSTSTDTGKHFNVAALGAGAALLGVGAAAAAGLGALATMGLTSAASLEQTKISFDSLLGSAAEGDRVFKQLQAFAAATPFEFPEIADAAKRFLAFHNSVGLTASGLQDYLTTVGNVISVTGGGAEAFGRINLAIGQIGSASKITLDNLNQIADAIPGFSPIAAIAKGLGVSTADAMAQVSAGTVGAAQGVQFLLAGMQQFPGAAGAMEKQSQTLMGVFSTFKDVVGQTLAQAFAPAIPAIKDTLAQLTPLVGEALGQLAPALGGLITSVLPIIGDLIGGIVPILTPVLDGLAQAFKAIGPVLKPLGLAIGAVVNGLAPLWPVIGKVVDALGQALTPVIAALAPILLDIALPLADILIALIPILPPLAELLRIVLLLIEPLILAASQFLQWLSIKALIPLVKLLAEGITLILLPISQFAEWLDRIDWGAVSKAIGGAFTKAWDAVSTFFVGIGRWFANLPGEIIAFIKSLPSEFVRILSEAMDRGLQAIGIGIGLIIFAIRDLPGMALDALIKFGPMVLTFFADTWTSVFTATTTWIGDMVREAIALPGKVIQALLVLGPMIGTLFTNAFSNGEGIVRRTIENIIEFVRSIPRRIGDFALTIGTSIVNFIKTFLNRAIDGVNSGIAKVDAIIPGDLPRIPRLAHGGIAMGPALIGEDSRTTPEAAIPLGDARAMQMLRDGLGQGGSTITFAQGSIQVNITGNVSAEQAKNIGENIGSGIANVLAQNNIRTAVRTA